LTHLPAGQLQIGIGADVADYDAGAHFDPKRLGMLDRFSQFALIAAREAIKDAGLDFKNADGAARRTAVILGTGIGGETTLDDAFYQLYAKGNPRVNPGVIPRMMASAATSHLTMEFGITGPAFTVTSACSSASHAIGQALWMLRQGVVDVVITGGSESCFTLGTMKAWEAMRVMAPDTCRPFSRDRRGMVLGEGAGVVVLERIERARERGATIHAELAGAGMSADAGHLIQPSENGAVDALRAALADAELNAGDIDYINAHGTGTAINDASESRAIRQLFGSQPPPVSSTKSMHGHALGASGALEIIATVLAVRNGVIPPTVNFNEPDPECDVDCVPNMAREKRLRAALSNSFAFGGLNAVLAVRKAE
jgi:nodulation protein E